YSDLSSAYSHSRGNNCEGITSTIKGSHQIRVPEIAEKERNDTLARKFKGPLCPHTTHPHLVRAYIARRLDTIKKSPL
ncbi:hypothetical protein PENTCL1PPCAC_29798, partial [Pristionchus entomophagus]